MAAVTNRQINVYINSGEAQKAYDVLIAREKLLNAELAKTSDPKRIKQLGAELDKLKEPIDRAAKKLRGDLAPSIRELEAATKKFNNEFKKTGDPEALRKFKAFRDQLDAAKAQMNGLGEANKSLTSVGIFKGAFWANLAAGAVQGFFSSFSGFLTSSVEEALEADAATRRLEATLSNLGRSDAFERLTRRADEMARQFRYLDNDDVVGVFNKLIDYGKLTERQMNDLLPVIINFGAKSKISLEESTSVIVKALEGNAKALKEYGINVKDAGSETERLNIIMTTLKEKVDGSAEAFQNSAKGGIAEVRQSFADLREEVGNNLLPLLVKLLNIANKLIEPFSYIFSGRSFIGDVNKGLRGQDLTIKEADDYEKSINSTFDNFLKIAKQKNKDVKDVTDEFVKNLLKRKAAVDASINQLIAGGNKDGAARTAIAESIAIQRFLDAQSPLDKVLGISGAASTPSLIKNTKKEVDDLIVSIKNLGETIRKELEFRSNKILNTKGPDGKGIDFAKGLADNLANITGNANRSSLAFYDLKVLKESGQKRLQAQLQLLDEEKRQELLNKNLTQNEILLIEEQYRQKREDAESSYIKNLIKEITAYAQQALNIFNTFAELQTSKENTELDADRRKNESKKRNLDNRLKAGTLSHLQYDRELQKIEKQQEKREKEVALKQFKRQKAQQLIQAVINTAEAVTAALPNLLLAAVVGGIGAAQIAFIASQKPPEFAKGGKLGGRSHSSGGNAVVDGSGRKIAEVEAGEGIVNKRTMADRRVMSVSGTPGQIISRLNGMYGVDWEGGATLVPSYRSYSPQRMNYGAMKRMYASGGVFSSTQQNEGGDNEVFRNLTDTMANMQATQGLLVAVLQKGIKAYSVLTETEKQQDRLDAIRDDATMR